MRTPIPLPAVSERLRAVRTRTLALFGLVTCDDVLRCEPMTGFRPLLWHLAHIGVFQNYWLLQQCAGRPSTNPRYDLHFDPIKTPREEARRLPERGEIERYLDETLREAEDFLAAADPVLPCGPAGLTPAYAVDLVIEHEYQHQETVAFLLQALPIECKRQVLEPEDVPRRYPPGEIYVPALRVGIGATDEAGFVYDNERPRYEGNLAAFFIDRDLTTNAEFAEFLDAGGYENRAWWSNEGWAWKVEHGIAAPLYWERAAGGAWHEKRFAGLGPIRADAPVTGVSWFEADAYARFRGKRLPNEEEWEAAVTWDPDHNRQLTPRVFDIAPRSDAGLPERFGPSAVGTRPVGHTPLDLNDVTGNVWQWTASPFTGYPGFVPYPYPEYSSLWFDGDHYVARGSSWFTAPALRRPTFRNFYRRHFRPAFLGIRCARSA
jgi:iron(II)-dependent oxidoreductase